MDSLRTRKQVAANLHDSFEQSLQIIAKSCYAKTFDDIEAIMGMLVDFLDIEFADILIVDQDLERGPFVTDALRFDDHNEWLDHYINRNLVRYDPVVEHALRLHDPLVWNDRLLDALSSERHQQFPLWVRRFGVSGGLVYPCPPRPGGDSVFVLYALAHGDSLAELANNICLISSLLHYPCAAVQRVYTEIHAPAADNPLTDRELEVLDWASQGKTSQEIAMILSISERTVKFHLSNTYEKLGVVNRQQAIAKAIHNRLL